MFQNLSLFFSRWKFLRIERLLSVFGNLIRTGLGLLVSSLNVPSLRISMCMMSVSVKLSISVHNSRIYCSLCCCFVVFSWGVESVRLKMITLLSLFSRSLASRFCSLTWFWMTSLTSLDVMLLSVWADVLFSSLAAAISSLTRFSSTFLFNSFSRCAMLSSTFFRNILHLSSQLFSFFMFYMTFFSQGGQNQWISALAVINLYSLSFMLTHSIKNVHRSTHIRAISGFLP